MKEAGFCVTAPAQDAAAHPLRCLEYLAPRGITVQLAIDCFDKPPELPARLLGLTFSFSGQGVADERAA
jgi:hypothetical protein